MHTTQLNPIINILIEEDVDFILETNNPAFELNIDVNYLKMKNINIHNSPPEDDSDEERLHLMLDGREILRTIDVDLIVTQLKITLKMCGF